MEMCDDALEMREAPGSPDYGEKMRMRSSDYDSYADEYADYVAWREQHGAEADPMGIVPPLLRLLGDVANRAALDAGCGEGFLARILSARGARVTGIDLSPRLIRLAREQDRNGTVNYRVADLSQPMPELAGHFDLIASYLVLNDVEDYQGFITTLASLAKSSARIILALNNPYAYVLRKRIGAAYFTSGISYPSGLAKAGINVRFYHRTLGEYLDACFAAGLQLTKLLDVDDPNVAADRRVGNFLPEEEALPRFMLLVLRKP